jgi:hypothetical protein
MIVKAVADRTTNCSAANASLKRSPHESEWLPSPRRRPRRDVAGSRSYSGKRHLVWREDTKNGATSEQKLKLIAAEVATFGEVSQPFA